MLTSHGPPRSMVCFLVSSCRTCLLSSQITSLESEGFRSMAWYSRSPTLLKMTAKERGRIPPSLMLPEATTAASWGLNVNAEAQNYLNRLVTSHSPYPEWCESSLNWWSRRCKPASSAHPVHPLPPVSSSHQRTISAPHLVQKSETKHMKNSLM